MNKFLPFNMKGPSVIVLIFLSVCFYGQVPVIQWQNTIGGNQTDVLNKVIETSDGGYFLAGDSYSGISGDKTELNSGENDGWIVKLDSTGNISWQNTIGGSNVDYLKYAQQTIDGGYILGFTSSSNISGDKTENSKGSSDYWIVKINSGGIIEWQKTIGGNNFDELYIIRQTSDEGFIMLGNSGSGISGDKTIGLFGGIDCWVVKTDDAGNIEWQKSFGGLANDLAADIIQTSDNGYLIGTTSLSGISGNKTEESLGYSDYWIIKTDNAGNILRQNAIGGSGSEILYSTIQTSDNNYLISGESSSGISGDKTEINRDGDLWIIKTDQDGNILWQNTISGNENDCCPVADETPDGGFIIGSSSLSGIGFDKSEINFGIDNDYDFWVIKINEIGDIVWENTIGGFKNDQFTSISTTIDNGYIIGGYSNSGISEDKTENVVGGTSFNDYWVIKLSPDESACMIPSPIGSLTQTDKAKVKWNSIADALTYRIRYRETGTEVWSYKITPAGKHTTVLNGLLCSTEYEWQIMSICAADGSSFSPYSESAYFITSECRAGVEQNFVELIIYPNPASDQINISFTGETGDAIIRIFNMNGEIVFENNTRINDSYQMSWNSENISSGIYQLQILVNGNNYTNKILINK